MSTTTKTLAEELADFLTPSEEHPGVVLEIHCIHAAAELRRLAAVEDELASTKKALALVQHHHTTAWNRGHQAGMRASRDAVKQAEPSSGSNAAAPVVAGPSDARVEVGAKALAEQWDWDWEGLSDAGRERYRLDARAVLQAADAVSAVAVPDGFVLVREKATPLIRDALRIGMRLAVPSDELCDIRWRAAIAAASPK